MQRRYHITIVQQVFTIEHLFLCALLKSKAAKDFRIGISVETQTRQVYCVCIVSVKKL